MMKTLRITVVSMLMLVTSLFWSQPTLAQSNLIQWGSWRFNYAMVDSAGIAIRNVYFNNELVLYKASMPVIRVQYPSINIAYADRVTYGVQVGFCGNQNPCLRSYSSGGRNWLELGVLTYIGNYEIYQAWYFSDDGILQPHLFSRGLQHAADHTHHVYWRMDFDINGAGSDQIFVFDNNRRDEGWGFGWHQYTNEVDAQRNATTQRNWFVRDGATGHGVWVVPRSSDGNVDNFSTIDMAGRTYHWNEDVGWQFGAWGELGYNNGESIQNTDVVLWYTAHLAHAHQEGQSIWHSGGPTIWVSR
jgi:hypothetical protein